MWGFGRVNKQASQPVKKQQENTTPCSLELIGDLIGHSSSVEVLFLTGVQMSRGCLLLHLTALIHLVSERPMLSLLAVGFAESKHRIG